MDSRRKPSSFFSFITSDNIKDTGLVIPDKFTKNHGKKLLLNNVVLVVSDDTAWELKWIILDNGELWFKNGWREFSEHYCLGLGNLLVFDYHGRSVFHVRIFDKSNCEINYLQPTNYPQSTGHRKPQNFFRLILSDVINDSSLRIPDKFTRKHRKKLLLNNEMLMVSDGTTWSLDWMISGNGKLWLKKGWREFAERYCFHLGRLLVFNYCGESVFHVRIFDMKSNCEVSYSLPQKFRRSTTVIYQSSKLPQADQMKAEEEDVFALFHNQETEVGVDLVVVHNKKKQGSSEATGDRALESAKDFKSDNPFCLIIIRASFLGRFGLYIPAEFTKKYLRKNRTRVNYVLQLSDGETFGPVKCKPCRSSARVYGEGWKRFCEDKDVSVGDGCVLELDKDVKNVMKVTIFRANHDDESRKRV